MEPDNPILSAATGSLPASSPSRKGVERRYKAEADRVADRLTGGLLGIAAQVRDVPCPGPVGSRRQCRRRGVVQPHPQDLGRSTTLDPVSYPLHVSVASGLEVAEPRPIPLGELSPVYYLEYYDIEKYLFARVYERFHQDGLPLRLRFLLNRQVEVQSTEGNDPGGPTREVEKA